MLLEHQNKTQLPIFFSSSWPYPFLQSEQKK